MASSTKLKIADRFRVKFPHSQTQAKKAMRAYRDFVAREGPFKLRTSTVKKFNIQQKVFGVDKHGHPVIYLNAGELDLSSLHDARDQQLLLQHCVCMWERALLLSPVHTAVYNLSSVSWGCLQPATLQMFSKILAIYDAHYPDISKQFLVINAPWFMPSIWPMLQGLLHQSLRDKIHFLSSPDQLRDYIDEDQIYKFQ